MVSSFLDVVTIRDVGASGIFLSTPIADAVLRPAVADNIGGRDVGEIFSVHWVTESGNRCDFSRRGAVCGSIVNDHGALRISGKDDLHRARTVKSTAVTAGCGKLTIVLGHC